MTTRLSLLLLTATLVITGLVPQGSAFPLNDPGDFRSDSSARDKSLLWRVHLALQLVKHRELNERQVRIILYAISLATPQFFAKRPAKTKADEDLQSLKRRALQAFPHSQVSDPFSNIAGGKAEEGFLKMYFDLAALPLKQRKGAFRNASSTDKSYLWKTHLALFLVKRPDLTERQKEIILAAMSLVTPQYFKTRSTDAVWNKKVREPLRSLERQIVAAFSFEDATKIFSALSDDTEDADRSATYDGSVLLKSLKYVPLTDSGPYKRWTHSRFGGQELELERNACQCSTKSDWCAISKACKGKDCSRTESGCGTLWTYPCDGASCQ